MSFRGKIIVTTVLLALEITTAGWAAALPASLYLPNEDFIVSLSAESASAKTELTGIRNLTGEGYYFSFHLLNEMEGLGKAELTFHNVKLGETSCGQVEISFPEWHAVPIAGGGWGILTLILSTTITCGSLKIKVRGSELVKVNTALDREVSPLETFRSETGKCSGSKPAFTEYESDGGPAHAKLESSIGLGFSESCEAVEGEIALRPSSMMEMM